MINSETSFNGFEKQVYNRHIKEFDEEFDSHWLSHSS